MDARINKIIDFSTVDGPGLRTSIFVQGCNIHCLYCHNPETQRVCNNCAKCVSTCPKNALSIIDNKVIWDDKKCINCDTCIKVCENFSSPKIKIMSAKEVYDMIKPNLGFIRGITISGGECMMNTDFILELFTLAKKDKLNCLLDSNGSVLFEKNPEITKICDGVMLDVKSWNEDIYQKLTGFSNSNVKKNLLYLAQTKKLEEIRIVCLESYVDAKNVIKGIYDTIGNLSLDIPLKLIKFRKYGVRSILENVDSPSDIYMNELSNYAKSLGFKNVFIR